MTSAGAIVRGSFDFIRRNIALVGIWSAIYACAGIAMSLLMRPVFDAQMEAIGADPPRLPEGFFGYITLIDIIFVVMLLVLFAATFRAVLKPEASAAAYVRLGMDEIRLLGLMLLMIVAFWIAIVAFVIAAAIVGLVVALIAGKAIAAVLAMLLYCGLFVGLIYASLRLSAAAPLTILYGRIVIDDAWKLTKGRFWTLFGAYAAIVAIVAVPVVLLGAIMLGGFYHHIVEAPYEPVAFQAAMRAQFESQAPGKPMWFFGVVLGGLLGGIGIALQGAMTAIATRELLREQALTRDQSAIF